MILVLMTVTFLVSALLTQWLIRPETALYIIDEPNARSLHTQPIPVSGGVAILVAIILSTTLVNQFYLPLPPWWWLGLCGLPIAVISFIDDCHQVPVVYRLLVHFLAAYLLLWKGELWLTQLILPGLIWAWPPWLQTMVSLLLVVWMVNLYNFMDGMDGFAGGMAIFGFGTLAILGEVANQPVFLTVNLIVASAVAGFLLFNFPPAKIFMGDVGASSLGFLAAAFGLWGHHDGIVSLWVTLLLFSPFIMDATITLLRRLLRGEKIWLAHKTHYYQRLVQLGWGHKRTVLWEYVLMAACSISALLMHILPPQIQWRLLISWCGIYIFLMLLVEWLERHRKQINTEA